MTYRGPYRAADTLAIIAPFTKYLLAKQKDKERITKTAGMMQLQQVARDPKEAKLRASRARRGRQTLFRKASQFHEEFDAEVYMVLYKNSRFYVYNSTGQTVSWPPPMSEIVSVPPRTRGHSELAPDLP